MDNNDRIFVGYGKQINEFYTTLLLTEEDMKNHYFTNKYNGKRQIRLTLGKKRQVDQHGRTHTIWVNDFNTEEQKEGKKPVSAGDHLPF
tara:strand:+ start:2162 stop:2428 length:267 start_codon:yes stop_codon:yes gene_type:complete